MDIAVWPRIGKQKNWKSVLRSDRSSKFPRGGDLRGPAIGRSYLRAEHGSDGFYAARMRRIDL